MIKTEIQTNDGSLYTVLQISKRASAEEVRIAYKKAAKLTHPDIDSMKSGEFEEINKAYTILANKKNRMLYNTFGDSILPILQDHRYSPYIEKMLSNRMIAAGGIVLGLFLLSTLFYPYLILLASMHILPYYTLTVIPHTLFYFGCLFSIYQMGMGDMRSKISHHIMYYGLLLVQMLIITLYTDSLVSTQAFLFYLVNNEIAHALVEVVYSLQYLELSSMEYVIQRTFKRIACVKYAAGALFRILLCGLFMVDVSPYARASLFPLYIFVLTATGSMEKIGGCILTCLLLVQSMFCACACRESMSAAGWGVAAAVLLLALLGVAKIVQETRKVFISAQWNCMAPLRITDKEC
ncbi:hypothetical protein NEMIN01_0928 [Nematocida minor]|uniref:uncharacterized protein n=1 Tax=Nematocida minor TaxID=1912983 RepID=UPI00221EE7A2|nr:uncharacterized protein NEMIN01_0928 [Nematocida minor]KAI5190229.1 hypothetical protein NEMIN01_0928 [Nematocida minor]